MIDKIEFYDTVDDSNVELFFDKSKNELTVISVIAGDTRPWLKGASCTNWYRFKEPDVMDEIIFECQSLEYEYELTELLEKYPHDFKQIAVDV